jgi:hypothetical protein
VPELTAAERVLWVGQPVQGIRFRGSDVMMIPFSLLWGGFVVFWEFSVLRTGAPVFLALWGMPFVLIGVYVIAGRFFVDARARSQTVYALTDRRVLILTGLFSRTTRSLDLRTLPEISLNEFARGTGTITFGSPAVRNLWGWPIGQAGAASAFEFVDGPRRVYEQIRAAQSAALAARA